MQDYFASAASYYARYRPFYPAELINDIANFFQLSKQDRVIDIGSGTGQLAIQLARLSSQVTAIEVDPGMLAEGQKLSAQHQADNINWLNLPAEDLATIPDLGTFKLATFGASFHWMDQPKLLSFLSTIIQSTGGIAVAGSKSIWRSTEVWEQSVKEIVQKHLGDERRAGTGQYQTSAKTDVPFIDLLKQSAFSSVKEHQYLVERQQTTEEVIGRLFSTSFANPAVLGDKKGIIESEIKSTLLGLNPSGIFTKTDEYYLFLARRP